MEEKIGDPTEYGKGAIASPLDERDYQWEEVAAAMAAPAFDWKKGYDIEEVLGLKITPKDQGSSGSCGGQAWSYLAAVQEALATDSYEERSAKFIYAQTAVPWGGSNGRSNSDVYKKQGVSVEPLCVSYDNGKPPKEEFMQRKADITAEARDNAKKAVAKNYVNVSPDIESIAQAIAINGGVVLGVDGTNNGTWRGRYPKAPVDGEEQWHHWLYAGKAKIIKGKKYIGVLNSWGDDTGDEGWQWLSEDYIKATAYNPDFGFERAVIWEVWSCVYNPNGLPVGYTHNFSKDISYGQRGEEVRALQLALQSDGSFPAGFDLTPQKYPNPYYGDITSQAVVKFRVKHGVDGSTDPRGRNAGPRTRAKLNELFNK